MNDFPNSTDRKEAAGLTSWSEYAHKPHSPSGVEKLVQRLEQQDHWFGYLVPQTVRNYSEEQLLAYLDNTYSAKGFRMDEPEMVSKYIQPRERVILKKVIGERCGILSPGHIGKVIEMQVGKDPLILFKVDWKYEKPLFRIPEKDLDVLGKMCWDGVIGDKSPDGYPRKGDCVAYARGGSLERYHLYVPAGSEGVVMSMNRPSKKGVTVNVVFMCHPKVIVPSPSIPVRIEDLALVRPNFIDYQKLRRECFTPSDFDKVEKRENE